MLLMLIYQYCNNGVSKEKHVKIIDNKWVFYKLFIFSLNVKCYIEMKTPLLLIAYQIF